MKYLDIPVFIVSLAIGLFFVYTTTESTMKEIYVFPTPTNIDKVQYLDNADNCFKFSAKEVTCKGNEKDYVVQ